MALVDEVGGALTAAGVVGGATGWTLRYHFVPDDPSQVVVLSETGGVPVSPVLGYSKPAVQVYVRGEPYQATEARSKLQDVHDAIHGYYGPLGGRTYWVIAEESGALPLGRDEKNRPEWTQNYVATVARV